MTRMLESKRMAGLLMLGMTLAAGPARAALPDLKPVRLDKVEIRLDGRLNDEVWKGLPPIREWYQQCPDEGLDPSVVTEARLVYDQDALYLGILCRTADPASLVSRSLERDSFTPDQDAVALILDTLDDNRTAFGFILTPKGVRTDIAISNDGESHTVPWNKDWNAFWDAAALETGTGWSAELRIPFSSLRFDVRKDRARMGLILWRYVACRAEYDIYPAIPNRWLHSAYKPSQARKVIFQGIRPGHPLYLRPYLLGGLGKASELNPEGTAYQKRSHRLGEAGFDLKYNLSSNLILDVTLNTDFAQVEADDEKINLTRFSLFFPEKRTFFQERADLFEFKLPGGDQRLFHSRSIGLVDDEVVPLLGGIRLTGRAGRWEIGFMEMQTGSADLKERSAPSENFGVLRLKRHLMRDGSFIGGMATTRTDFKGNSNILTALDADIRLKFPHFLNFYLARSFEPESDSSRSWMSSLIFRNRIERGFSYGVSATHIGEAFHPGMGFLTRSGINRFGSRFRYTWFPHSGSPLLSHGWTTRLEVITGAATDRLETMNLTLGWSARLRSGAEGEANLKYTRENLIDSFEIGEVMVPAAEFRFWYGELKLKSSPGRRLRIDVEAKGGEYYGGRSLSGTLTPSWTIGPHLGVKLDFNTNVADLPDGDYLSHVVRMRILSALDRRLSANAFVQYNSDTGQLSSNLRLRFNPSEGVDLYIVYNEGIHTVLDLETPRLPRCSSRTLLVKFNYTFVI